MAEPSPDAGAAFRLLLVCAGNVCRSPLGERLVRARLGAALGAGANAFLVTSAGTEALSGTPMDPRAAAVARSLGADPDGFRARPLTADLVADADLVLAATREQRAEAVRLHPPAHRYAFTIREFARLVAGIPAGDRPAGQGPPDRARALVPAAQAMRGAVRARRPEDDDIPDPRGTVDRVHQTVGAAIDEALIGPLDVICGTATAAAGERVRPRRRRWRVPWRGGAGGRTRPSGPSRLLRPSGRSGRSGPSRRLRPSGRPGPSRRSRPSGRLTRRLAAVVGLALLAAVGWLAVRGLAAQRELVVVRADLGTVRSALLAGDPHRAGAALADARRLAARARGLTDDPVWRLAGLPPYLGNAPRAVRTLAAAVDGVTSRALPALVDAGVALAPDRLRPTGDRIDVDAFARARPGIDAAAAEIALARARLDDLDSAWLPRPVGSAVHELRAELGTTASTLDDVDRVARLVPPMLGTQRPRRYLLVFQNSAEARGTGGLPGLYAVLLVDHGRTRIERLGSNTDLKSADRLPVDLGPEYAAQWGQDPALWPNSNLDPSFPNAARIWLALWRRQTGQLLDGAVATDPVAVSYLLGAVGPVRLPGGERVEAGTVARLTMSEVYRRFPDTTAQNEFLREVAHSAIVRLLTSRGRPRSLVDGLARAARERRLLVYSRHAEEQRDLAATPVGGTLPDGAGPYAFVVVNNLAGGKMDYYLQRSLTYTGGPCVEGQRASRITIRFGNAAPPTRRLPDYVVRRGDVSTRTLAQSAARGSVVVQVSVYGPRGAGILRSTLDGRPVPVSSHLSDGRPVWGFPLVVGAGRWRAVVLDVVEPASGAAAVVPVQPLVQPQAVQTEVATCA
jgi:protein-tyrosine-phosphatase